MAAGTITLSSDIVAKGYRVMTFAWTSDGSGDVNGTAFGTQGILLRVVTNPGATAPDDNYDLTLLDADAVDVLEGAGADRDTANSQQISLLAPTSTTGPIALAGQITPTIANAGSGKNGTITLYLK